MGHIFVFYLFILSSFTASLFAVYLTRHNYGKATPLNMSIPTDWARILRDADIPPTCSLAHLRLLARHGSRTWGRKEIEAAQGAVSKITQVTVFNGNFPTGIPMSIGDGPVTLVEFNRIRNWRDQIGPQQDLVERGRAENEFLARDYYTLLSQTGLLQRATFNFESSNTKRAKESAATFRGQWDRLTNQPYPEPIMINEARYHYHNQCPAYTNNVAMNSSVKYENQRAKSSVEAFFVIEKINKKRLLFTANVLTFDDIFALYEAAAYEMTVLGSSVFAPLFDPEDEAFLAFSDDLVNFWTGAYGFRFLADMSCPLVNNIFETADLAFGARRQQPPGQPPKIKSGFGFFHLEDLMPVYAAFSLFHDPESFFVGTAPRSFYTNRKFDTSQIGTFAANMAFLFFDCLGVPMPADQLLIVVVNGRPQMLPLACPNALACPVMVVKTAYPTATGYPGKCDFTRICAAPSPASSSFVPNSQQGWGWQTSGHYTPIRTRPGKNSASSTCVEKTFFILITLLLSLTR